MTDQETAADWAAAQVARIRDDPAGAHGAAVAHILRAAGPRAAAPAVPASGAVVHALGGQARGPAPPRRNPPGSRWWRAVNERLLLDGWEAMARSGGHLGEPSSPAIELWMSFITTPAAATWYRAHNASIVSGYLEHRDLAELESMPERFFLNVALLRVLYTHTLVAAPRLAPGRFAALGRILGDPRLGMAGAFLSLRRVLPDHYWPNSPERANLGG